MTVGLQHRVEDAVELVGEVLNAGAQRGKSCYRDDRNQREHKGVLNKRLPPFG